MAKLSDIIDKKAKALVATWAERNRHHVWLGANSRKLIEDEVREHLLWAYKLGKKNSD